MKKRPEKTYSVAVVATMSAGKSTLLNAMIGRSLLPTSCLACTSSIFSVVDVDEAHEFEVRSNERGRAKWIPADRKTLAAMNTSGRTNIELRGNLPGIANLKRGGIRVKFIDTPGPNNSENVVHGVLLRNALKKADFSAVIFVLNAASLHTTDELSLLRHLNDLLCRRKGRVSVAFVLNRMDAFFHGGECNKSLSEMVSSTRMYLQEKLGFNNPAVIPTWAALSLECRRLLHEENYVDSLDEDEEDAIILGMKKIQTHRTEIEDATLVSQLKRDAPSGSARGDVIFRYSRMRVSRNDLINADRLSGIPMLEQWAACQMARHFRAENNSTLKRRKVL